MKKLLICLMFVLFLCSGCSSSSAAESGNAPTASSRSGDSSTADDNKSSGFIIHETTPTQTEEAKPEQTTDNTSLDPVYTEADFDVSKLSYEDFDELYGQMMYEGIPEDRVATPLGNANGLWRYNLKIRRDSSTDGYWYDELGYAEMSVHDVNDPPVKITLHPRLASDKIEVWPETDESIGYEPFAGRLENNVIKLIGNNAVLELKYYYAWEGREYLIATLWLSEEEFGDFMMIRGQD